MKKIIPFVFCMLVALVACEKKEPSDINVETGNVTNITQTTATIDGVLQIDITDYNSVDFGVMYSTSIDAISNYTSIMRYGEILYGSDFSVDLTGLTEDTKYYYCSFVFLNNMQYELGEIKDFTTLSSEKTPDIPNTPIVPEEPIPSGSREYVDLGLSSGTLWATCNIGAESPEEYGNYYAWGETTTKDYFSNNNYYIWGGSDLTSSYDVASATMGGNWRMPYQNELEELRDKCNWTLTEKNGIKGYLVTSTLNGKSIFLPLAGVFSEKLYNVGEAGNYRSRSANGDYFAYGLYMNHSEVSVASQSLSTGISVRAVLP